MLIHQDSIIRNACNRHAKYYVYTLLYLLSKKKKKNGPDADNNWFYNSVLDFFLRISEYAFKMSQNVHKFFDSNPRMV